MSTAEAIRQRAEARRLWLERALSRWQATPDIVAVWLWGSGGRGIDDALSDWDIFLAWSDAGQVAVIDHGWFQQFGEVLWWQEDPYNAPLDGRYIAVGYPAPFTPLPVDWYLEPASSARIGADTRVLLERSPLPRAAVETFQLFPTVADETEYVLPVDPVERVQHQLEWFWFMFIPMAKWAARDDRVRIEGQLDGLNRVVADAVGLVGGQPVQTTGEHVFATVRRLADAMQRLHPALRFRGVEIPAEYAERLRKFDETEDIRRSGWLR